MRTKKISVIFGACLEAIKLCPVVLAMKSKSAFECKVCVTGQRREMLLPIILDVFGIMVGYVTVSEINWILKVIALTGNPYDGKTLSQILKQAESISGVKPQCTYCDLRYRGRDCKGDCDFKVVNRFKKCRRRTLLLWWKRRSTIEPVLAHIKGGHYMERNRLVGEQSDKLIVMLSALGFTLMKVMKAIKTRWIKRFFLFLYVITQRILSWMREICNALMLQNRFYEQTHLVPFW